MGTFYKPIPGCTLINSTYVPPENNSYGNDALVASVKDNVTGETKLHIIKNPQTQVYVAKEGLRNYDLKREYANKSDCDMYITPYRFQFDVLADALKIRPSDPFRTKRAVQSSPYVYGWDVDPGVRLKCDYMKTCPELPSKLVIGMLDIETSVLGDEQILCISICNWHTREVHCFILNEWLQEPDTKQLDERTIKEHRQFEEGLNSKALEIWKQKPIKTIYHICANEKELLIQTFKYIHSCKFDFMGIWNAGFDMPYMIKRAEFRQLDLVELFCHPDVPSEYRMFKWKEDTGKLDHFTDAWHWCYCPGYTVYLDVMCLYSRLRKVKGRDVFYTLDYIGNRIIGTGKMRFGANATHYHMQTNDKVGYCVYNTEDVIIPALMEAITTDIVSLLALADCAMLCDFSKQTVQIKAQFFRYLSELNKIPGAIAGSIKRPYDHYIGNIGGAVLNPNLMKVRGLPCILDTPRQSFVYKLAQDLDVSGFYPSVTIAANVSKETKVLTVIWVEGCPYALEDMDGETDLEVQKRMAKANALYINNIFGRIVNPSENAIAICKDYFGLPGYDEMLVMYDNVP